MTANKKRTHTYRITVEELGEAENTLQTLELSLEDREDLFKAVENIKAGSGLAPEQATKMAVALRLIGPLMMKDRKHPLFESFFPHFKTFMQQLKDTVKSKLP